MSNDKIEKSNNKLYESVEKLKSKLKREKKTIQDYDLENPVNENDKIKFEVLNNEGIYGILVSYLGTLNLKARNNEYDEADCVEDIYLRKFYPMKKESALAYYNQVRALNNLLDTPLFGFDSLARDLLQEIELELALRENIRKRIHE